MSLGNRGHIGIKKETTWGERVAADNDCFLPFVTEGLTRDIEEVLSAIQRGVLDEPKSYQGEKAFGGPLVVEVHPMSIGHILRSALGIPTGGALADRAITVLDDCEDVWDETEGVNGKVIVSKDTTDRKVGLASVKFQVTADVGADEILATEAITQVDMSTDTALKLWIKCSEACPAGGELKIIVSEVAGCAGVEGTTMKTVDVPILVANTWTPVTITLAGMGDLEAVDSIGIVMHENFGECVIHIDDVRRVGPGTADKAYKHVFTPMQTLLQEFGDGQKYCPLWPYTFEVFRDEGQAYEFLGCVVNTMALSFSTTDKILKATLGIIAANAGYVGATGLSLETTNPFVWENARIYLAEPTDTIDTSLTTNRYDDLESFTLNWDNKCVAKYALNNTAIPRKIIRAGYREIPISFTVDFTTKTEYDKFLAGTERQVIILFEGAIVKDSGGIEDALDTKYTLKLEIPSLRYLAWPVGIGGPGRLSVAVTGKAKYYSTYPLRVTLINNEAVGEYQE